MALYTIFTTRKRSLRQGNVFTPAYHSVHRGKGVGFPACITGHMTSIWGKGVTGHMTRGGGSASREMVCLRGDGGLHPRAVCIQWGGRSASKEGWAEPPPPPPELGKRVVRILLECFLVPPKIVSITISCNCYMVIFKVSLCLCLHIYSSCAVASKIPSYKKTQCENVCGMF